MHRKSLFGEFKVFITLQSRSVQYSSVQFNKYLYSASTMSLVPVNKKAVFQADDHTE